VILTHDAAISGVERVRGFLDTVEKKEGIRVVQEIPCEGKLELAMPRMEEFIEKNVYFDNVFCLNDPACIGAAAALDAHDLLDRVNLYGVDASPDGKALIREGAIQASAAQFPTRVGEQAADTLYRLLNGEKVESRILVPVELVTQENVEEYSIDRWQ
jgi:ribose transport system substrate-binding protein